MSNICYICGKHYENSYYITEHKKTFHGKSENLPCEVCGEIFVNRRWLKGHKTRNHTDNTYHQCNFNKILFKINWSLSEMTTENQPDYGGLAPPWWSPTPALLQPVNNPNWLDSKFFNWLLIMVFKSVVFCIWFLKETATNSPRSDNWPTEHKFSLGRFERT